eukprot:PhF_6_TR36334/c1_g1_i1/m.53216
MFSIKVEEFCIPAGVNFGGGPIRARVCLDGKDIVKTEPTEFSSPDGMISCARWTTSNEGISTTRSFTPTLEIELVSDTQGSLGKTQYTLFMQQLWYRKLVYEGISIKGGVFTFTISVCKEDREGYKTRLTNFFRLYNEEILSKIDDIMTNPEIETFNKTYDKYRVVDYVGRATSILKEHNQNVADAEKHAADGETSICALLRTLRVSEPLFADGVSRIAAYAAEYGLEQTAVDSALAECASATTDRQRDTAMSTLVSKHEGKPEPPLKTYLFGPSFIARLRMFFESKAVVKTQGELETMGKEYKNKELDLLDSLVAQYGPEPPQATLPPKVKTSRKSSVVGSRKSSKPPTPKSNTPKASVDGPTSPPNAIAKAQNEIPVPELYASPVRTRDSDPIAPPPPPPASTSSRRESLSKQQPPGVAVAVPPVVDASTLSRKPSNAQLGTAPPLGQSEKRPPTPTIDLAGKAPSRRPSQAQPLSPSPGGTELSQDVGKTADTRTSPDPNSASVEAKPSDQLSRRPSNAQQQNLIQLIPQPEISRQPSLSKVSERRQSVQPSESQSQPSIPDSPSFPNNSRSRDSPIPPPPTDPRPPPPPAPTAPVFRTSVGPILGSNSPVAPLGPMQDKFRELSEGPNVENVRTPLTSMSRHEEVILPTPWDQFLYRMEKKGVDLEDVKHCSDAAFVDLLVSFGFDAPERARILTKWKERSSEGFFVSECLHATNPSFSELKDLIALQSNLDGIGVVLLAAEIITDSSLQQRFAVHIATHSQNPNLRKVVVPADYLTIRSYAKQGLVRDKDTRAYMLNETLTRLVDPISNGGTIFHALVCDVALGNILDVSEPSAITETPEVDSFRLNQQLYVLNPDAISPRFFVSFKLDSTVVACQTHRDKVVEFWCEEDSTMICSHCAVLGHHRSHRVTSLESAAAEARSRLPEISNSAKSFCKEVELTAFSIDQAVEEVRQGVTTKESISRAAEVAKEDVDRHARQLLNSIESAAAAQESALRQSKDAVKTLSADAERIARHIDDAMNSKYPTDILKTLDKKRAESLENLRNRADSINIPSYSLPKYVHGTSPSQPQQQQQASPTDLGRIDFVEKFAVSPMRSPKRTTSTAGTNTLESQPILSTTPSFAPRSITDLLALEKPILSSSPSPILSQPPPMQSLETSTQKLMAYHQRKQMRSDPSLPTVTSPQQPSPAPRVGDPLMDDADEREARAQMAQGWKFFRAGDKGKARSIWMEVFTAYGHTCSGTRARAYVAEAIEKGLRCSCTMVRKSSFHQPAVLHDNVQLWCVVGDHFES